MTEFWNTLRRLASPQTPSQADLADLGLSQLDYDILLSGRPGARQRLISMAARFGLDEAQIDRDRGIAFQDAETCARCRVSRQCQQALDGQGEMPKEACPNATLYRMLAAE